MIRHYLIPTLTLAALSISGGACSPRDTTDRTASLSDSAAAGAKSAAGSRMATKTGEVRELQAPEAARWDSDQNVWFVANINGDPFGKDNNGFIARLTPEGKVDSLKFIAGGRRRCHAQRAQGHGDHGGHALGGRHRRGPRRSTSAPGRRPAPSRCRAPSS